LRHPPPTSGAHDILRFSYSAGRLRTIKVTRDGYHTVTVEGLHGEWAPTRPLHASIDLLLPAELREDLGNPTSYPPSEQPEYISEEDALAIALGGRQALDDVERPPAYARLMGRRETATLDPSLGAYNYSPHPARKVWVVCVHGEARTRGSPAWPPELVHGYSLVIDAETGMVTDWGTGSAPLGRENCPVCRQES
ncbi:MAG: hypothetical protein JOZ41_01210, partial [Chloroflexi bacterium]|nr:hypothetical protein [Chloroflexota bacterium]